MAPNTSVVNADNISSSKIVVQFNPVTQLPIKLASSHNFSLWKAQVSMLMRGHNLFGHLDGSILIPSKTISENNLELIQNAILATMDATIGSAVASAPNAKVSWDALHATNVNKSQTCIFSLRDRLARLSKDSRLVADYLHQVRSLCDELATTGSPVSNEELVVKILTGLGSEFREISAAIRARDSAIPYEELYEKLLDQELFLQHEEAKKITFVPITANFAQGTATAYPSGLQQ
ncbi:hypothetical protein KY290_010868 [Solanum tuberosum]|uniref:Retrotransposon Copia-like N-terminal domain-containing protein n=1 Tax=Solanum tuberosum TaxID=4113 RepID=A0ABQ7W088_SOLTU|nr:hypothetical protein KY290_010868 [Solanum tuberosum]